MTTPEHLCLNCHRHLARVDASQVWCKECSALFGDKGPRKERARLRGLVINQVTRPGELWLGVRPDEGLLWYVQIDLPWEASLYSKNRMLVPHKFGTRMGIGKSVGSKIGRSNIKLALLDALEKAGRSVVQCRTWVDILVERETHNGDAQNVLDSVADAIQEAIGVDDRWYSIRRIDWSISKLSPRMFIGIGQTALVDMFVCASCGRELPQTSGLKGWTAKDSWDCLECANRLHVV